LGAEETKAVFARAQELAAGSEDAAERFVRHYGRWGVSLMRGDLALARATAETFLQEARREGGAPDIVAAGRMAGLACFQQGDFLEARSHFEEVLGIYDREWDGEAKYRHGMDSGICATAYLAHVIWYAGEVERARDLIEEASGAPLIPDTFRPWPILIYSSLCLKRFATTRNRRCAMRKHLSKLLESTGWRSILQPGR
jgi:hypothetical protein